MIEIITGKRDLMNLIRREFFHGVSTMANCACGRPARGGGKCKDCLTNDLAKHVGLPLALSYLDAVSKLHEVESDILESP